MTLHDEVRKKLESGSIEESLERVETLLAQAENPKPLHLGIQLALRIAKEIQEGQAPGSQSGVLVQQWSEVHSQEAMDEAVDFARQFLLKPLELKEKIKLQLDEEKSSS